MTKFDFTPQRACRRDAQGEASGRILLMQRVYT